MKSYRKRLNIKNYFTKRIPRTFEIAHWEFYNWQSFLNTSEGLYKDSNLEKLEDWVELITEKTKFEKEILLDVLTRYKMKQRK